MPKPATLREFQFSELIFDTQETKLILGFIFKSKISIVNSLTVDESLRSFAQALLLEAVDASYALGFIQALTGSLTTPTPTVRKIIKKFAQKSLKHWFKHATSNHLLDIKIYEIVRRDLEWSFGRVFLMSGTAMRSKIRTTTIAYNPTTLASIARA